MRPVLECRQNRRVRLAWGLRLHDRTDLDAGQLSKSVVTLSHVTEDVTAVESASLAAPVGMGVPVVQPVHFQLDGGSAEESGRLGNIRHHAARSHGIFPVVAAGQRRNERHLLALRPEKAGAHKPVGHGNRATGRRRDTRPSVHGVLWASSNGRWPSCWWRSGVRSFP